MQREKNLGPNLTLRHCGRQENFQWAVSGIKRSGPLSRIGDQQRIETPYGEIAENTIRKILSKICVIPITMIMETTLKHWITIS